MNTKNLKEKFRKTEDWKGWKWGYYFIISYLLLLFVLVIWDTLYVVINNGYPPLGLPIGSECCGWSYKSVENHTIFGIAEISYYLLCIIIIRKLPKYCHKVVVMTILIIFWYFCNIFFNPLP